MTIIGTVGTVSNLKGKLVQKALATPSESVVVNGVV